MSEAQTVALSLRAAYAFGTSHGLEREVAAIRDMVIEWDRYNSSLRRGYILDLFEKHGIFEEFKASHWSFGATRGGEAKIRFYRRIKQQYEEFLAKGGPEVIDNEDAEGQVEEQQFAAESDLRDFLAQNPSRIEPGLQLYESGDQSGIEYQVEGGFIDLLMIDRNQRFVVVELKVGRGRNRTIGQLLYYMGWVDKNLGKAPCRGMIIAKEISEDLLIAVQRVPGVSLHRYLLSVSIQPVSAQT
jgi:Endonuclease NucS